MSHQRIDVHHHLLPAAYVARLRARGVVDAGGRPWPEWTPEASLALMEEQGIASAILSLSAPGVHWSPDGVRDDGACTLARELNEQAATIVRDHPGRFGFFATVPLPDVDGATAEAIHALDVLGADGVVLLANTHGRYLGLPEQETLYRELARRNAVVFVHPAELPGPRLDHVPPFDADFLLDTTRAAYLLVRHDVVRRHPSIRFILSHAGGFVPYASHRLAMAIVADTGRPPSEVLDDLSSFYFDTALSGSHAALPSLLAFAKPGHVLFGSDFPFAPPIAIGWFTGQLDAWSGLDDAGRAAIDRGNAAALFPRLATEVTR